MAESLILAVIVGFILVFLEGDGGATLGKQTSQFPPKAQPSSQSYTLEEFERDRLGFETYLRYFDSPWPPYINEECVREMDEAACRLANFEPASMAEVVDFMDGVMVQWTPHLRVSLRTLWTQSGPRKAF